jgi:hypothetical protein
VREEKKEEKKERKKERSSKKLSPRRGSGWIQGGGGENKNEGKVVFLPWDTKTRRKEAGKMWELYMLTEMGGIRHLQGTPSCPLSLITGTGITEWDKLK